VVDPDWMQIARDQRRRILYDDEIRNNDKSFDLFLKTLDELGLRQDTLIIFIADHGEHMGEHLLWDHKPPGYRQVLHVPLIMVGPGNIPGNKIFRQPVQLLDIMPTVLDLAGLETEHLLMSGDSLVPLIRGENTDFWASRPCFSEEVKDRPKTDPIAFGSIFFQKWHILNSDRLNDVLSHRIQSFNDRYPINFPFETRVFDLSVDTQETYDLPHLMFDFFFIHQVKTFLNELRQQNLKTWRTMTKGPTSAIKFDSNTIEQLRSLGYVN